MSKNTVKCGVVSCYYNGDGDCSASEVLVKVEKGHQANKSADTICETFKPKGE